MSWLRVDDGFAGHNKVAPLSDAALRLWLLASCWSRQAQNLKHEGRIPEGLLVAIGQNRWPLSKAKKLAQELVDARGGGLYENGLWLAVDGGWQIHDWHWYGIVTSDDDSLAAKRSEAGRRGAASRWQTDGKPDGKPPISHVANDAIASGNAMPPNPIPNPEEEDPPTPTNGSESGPRLKTAKTRDPMGDHLRKQAPRQRADVQRLHGSWKKQFGFHGHKLLPGNSHEAEILAESLDAHGPEDCELVVQFAPEDPMVNGRGDENKQKHESIPYIFGNQQTFARILRAAKKAQSSEETIEERYQRLAAEAAP
jgi:hypothetical protein